MNLNALGECTVRIVKKYVIVKTTALVIRQLEIVTVHEVGWEKTVTNLVRKDITESDVKKNVQKDYQVIKSQF